MAEAYVGAGRPEDAVAVATRLRALGVGLDRLTLVGLADRIDAQVVAESGDLDTAAKVARRAVTAHESSPLRLELVRSLLVLGRIERRRNQPGSRCGAVHQRPYRRDPRRVDLPQARRADPRRAWPSSGRTQRRVTLVSRSGGVRDDLVDGRDGERGESGYRRRKRVVGAPVGDQGRQEQHGHPGGGGQPSRAPRQPDEDASGGGQFGVPMSW